MSVNLMNAEQRLKAKYYNSTNGVLDLADVYMEHSDDFSEIYYRSSKKMMPDLKMVWDTVYKQYRVYILVAEKGGEKEVTGFPIMVVKSRMAASFLVVLYQILHKYRAGNKVD